MADYFTYLPQTTYKGVKVVDILARAAVLAPVLKNSVIYYPYSVKDGERPDIIAHKYYGSSELAWLVLFSNSIIDPVWEWPLTTEELQDYVILKYGSLYTATHQVHHYVNSQGLIVDEATFLDSVDAATVYCYDYEVQRNDTKRQIRLIGNVYAAQIVNEIGRLFL